MASLGSEQWDFARFPSISKMGCSDGSDGQKSPSWLRLNSGIDRLRPDHGKLGSQFLKSGGYTSMRLLFASLGERAQERQHGPLPARCFDIGARVFRQLMS
jgi:hypothetical protein